MSTVLAIIFFTFALFISGAIMSAYSSAHWRDNVKNFWGLFEMEKFFKDIPIGCQETFRFHFDKLAGSRERWHVIRAGMDSEDDDYAFLYVSIERGDILERYKVKVWSNNKIKIKLLGRCSIPIDGIDALDIIFDDFIVGYKLLDVVNSKKTKDGFNVTLKFAKSNEIVSVDVDGQTGELSESIVKDD